jgi:hypothetical protein
MGIIELTRYMAERDDLPTATFLLKPFGKSIRAIQEAAGYEPLRRNFDSWTAEDSIRLYKEVSGDAPLGRSKLEAVLHENKELPSVTVILKPFKRDIQKLIEAAGYKPF